MPQKYGALANAEPVARTACVVCDDPAPVYSWTDMHGEGYCLRCGTPYQLRGGTLAAGENYPRFNIDDKWLPVMRRYYAETKRGNGSGTFLSGHDYPDQLRDREAFNEWFEAHKRELQQRSEVAQSDAAVDPSAANPGTPTPRESESSPPVAPGRPAQEEPPCVSCSTQESSDGDWYRICGKCRWSLLKAASPSPSQENKK